MFNRDNPKIPLSLFRGFEKLSKEEQQERLYELLAKHFALVPSSNKRHVSLNTVMREYYNTSDPKEETKRPKD